MTVAEETPVKIQFRKISLDSAKLIAGREHKPIFIDVYTTWCVPCKQFERSVFTNDSVAEVFNELFINLKIDAEKNEGLEITKRYLVGGYPTGIFINSDADRLIQFEGLQTCEDFIDIGKRATKILEDPNGYENALLQYNLDQSNIISIRNLLEKSVLTNHSMPAEAMDLYLKNCSGAQLKGDGSNIQKWLKKQPNIEAGSSSYLYFVNNLEFTKKELHLDNDFFSNLFYASLQSELQKAIYKKNYATLNKILQLNNQLNLSSRKAQNIDFELQFYSETKDWENYFSILNKYCHAEFDQINLKHLQNKQPENTAEKINEFALNYLYLSNNKKELRYAHKLMLKCIQLNSEFAAYYDTDASLLLKLGLLKKAIKTAEKAVLKSAHSPLEKKLYSERLERVKKGEKIWQQEDF